LEISGKQVEQQIEVKRTDEAKPKQIGVEKDAIIVQPEFQESKLENKASEHNAEQVIQEKKDHSGEETYQILEKRQQNECDSQHSEANRAQDMRTKSEQIESESNSTDK
jgi:ribosomal protein S6E (S10)